jgi:hypothetical protein
MLAEAAGYEALQLAGWSPEVWDVCYLECGEPGYLRRWTSPDGVDLYIALCLPHAVTLEHGVFNGSYRGAPLPSDSRCTEWPWRRCDEPEEAVV